MQVLDNIIFWAAVSTFIVIGGLLIDAAVRFTLRNRANTTLPPGNTTLELVWATAPAILLAIVALFAYQSL